MKLILILVGVCLILSSCQEKDEVYSCNSEINYWVKDNLDSINLMTRTQILKLDVNYQVACYRALSPQNAQMMWVEKFNEMLSLDFWNDAERSHLKKMRQYLQTTSLFSSIYEKNEQIMDDFEIFVYKWKDLAINELGWNRTCLYFMLADLGVFTKEKYDGIVSLNILSGKTVVKTRSEAGGGQNACNCNGSYIPLGNSVCNTSYACDKSDWGCGDFLMQPCNGLWEKRI